MRSCSEFVLAVATSDYTPDFRPGGDYFFAASSAGFLLIGPGSREDSCHAVVPLVAGVLEDRALGPDAGDLGGPRLSERRRVIDREGIEERIRIDTREALDQVHILAGAAEGGLVGEVGGVDHQGVAL